MLNLFAIEGRFTQDPQQFTSKSGNLVVRCSIAVQESKEVVHFLDFTAFGKAAEIISKWCTKGSLVSVQGKLTKDSYTDKSGKKVTSISLIANSVSLLAKAQVKEQPEQRERVYRETPQEMSF